jgi:photosystem II stability/assembly factor-like uncharacterized protein
MKRFLPLLALASLVLAALACSGGDGESLPPIATVTPEPIVIDAGNGVDTDGFFSLNLTQSDQEGLEKRADEIYQKLVNSGGDVNRGALLAAYAELANYQPVGGKWRAAGPAPIDAINMPQGHVPGSGRVNGFAVDPRNSDVVYAAASVGGIWKTEDDGRSWRSLTDNQIPLIYGGLVMDPRASDTLYALLGEFDGQLSSDYGFLANGIMRTRDSGATWELVGAEEFNGASVTALVIADDGTLYASSGQTAVYSAPSDQPDFGIFRSTDGGDSWTRVVACSDYGNCQPGEDSGITAYLGGFMDLDLSGDGTLYASLCNVECYGSHFLRSKDGGESWEELDYSAALKQWEKENDVSLQMIGANNDVPYVEGFEIAASKSDPNVILAGGGLYWVDKDKKEGSWSWVIRSTDGGDSWEYLPGIGDYCSGGGSSPQCTYDNIVEIDPTDSNVMYVGGSFIEDQDTFYWQGIIQRSSDGGDTWSDLTPPQDGSLMHPDAHGLAFDPNDTNVLWVGSDGGIYRTPDASADPPEWQSRSQGLNTLLFIGIGLHPTDPNYIVGGLQDNANAYTTDGGKTWHGASQGDGGDAAVDPFKPDIVYSFQYQNSLSRNENGGHGDGQDWFGQNWEGYSEGLSGDDSWLFYPPFVLDPNHEGVMYVGSNRIYKSEDRGDSWSAISDSLTDSAVQSLALAPSDSDVIYVGTTDGLLWTTTDGGQNWEQVTASNFPPRNVTNLAVDPADSQTAYAVFGGFELQTPDAKGHVFRTTDGGRSWDDITLNLPDAPLSSVVVDGRSKYAGVYVGGALGVWTLQAGADQWLPYGTGMPFAIVSDLELNPDTGILAAATYGRSVWVMEMP